MEVLKLLAAATPLVLAACYEPRFDDCVVRCSSADECAPGQACGAHGYCAAPQLACGPGGAAGGADGGVADGGTAKVQLHVKISGTGKVLIEGTAMCDSESSKDGDCLLWVIAGVPRSLRAIPAQNYTFDQWASTACSSAGATCSLTLTQPLTEVHAKFRREGDDE